MTGRKKVALKDIARQVGVSTALVSYVLNGKFTDRIHPDTAKKIRDVADGIKYRPNQIAKSLKNSKTLTIGLIVADISNLYYSGIARVIEDAAKKRDYNVLFGSADEKLDKFEELMHVFISRQVDGIILASPEHAEDRLHYLMDQKIPFVLIDRYFPKAPDFYSVIINNYESSARAAEHLLQNGFRNPAMITLAGGLQHLQDRVNGFTDTVEKKRGAGKANVIALNEETLADDIEEAVLGCLKKKGGKVDALYFSTNKIAIEGLGVLAKHQVRVPDQVGVVCFDEADAYKIFNTSVTFVKQPLPLIGKTAVELLLDQIDGKDVERNIILQTELVEGKSSLPKQNK